MIRRGHKKEVILSTHPPNVVGHEQDGWGSVDQEKKNLEGAELGVYV